MSTIPEKNKERVAEVNELSKRKVVEHNELITSIAKMDKTPLKIFELAVSLIDTTHPPEDNTVYLSKSELFSFFKVSDNDKYKRFKQAIDRMQKQAVFQIKKEKGTKYISIVPIPYVEWTDYNDEVKIEFHREIMPYLINLKDNFTQYALTDISELNSKYSVILYRWLSMYYNQYEHYSVHGGRRESQIESYRHPTISMKELREITDTGDIYDRFTKFESRVLKEPLAEINKHTHLNVSYEKIKKGLSIDSIIFHITKKQMADDPTYKRDDPTYQEYKAKQEDNENELVIKAIQNDYTQELVKLFLLNNTDLSSMTVLAGLQKNVYPLYDQMQQIGGKETVIQHMAYVSDKQDDFSKHNVVGYLKKSAEQYLGRLK